MGIIKDNKEVPIDYDILIEKWKNNGVTKDREIEQQGYLVFNNTANVLEKLNHHFSRNSTIAFHTDVDVDGLGTTYIFKKLAENVGATKHLFMINKDKVHGVQQKHADYINKVKNVDLMIITDSSSNEIDIIKQFNCDVICVDHHELLHNDLYGKCNDGIHDYIIVNNTIKNYNQDIDNLWLRKKSPDTFGNLLEYNGDKDMSCGVVVYELLRLYCVCFGHKNLLENLMLYQWAGITLLTDVINTLNDRNQWYLNKTISYREVEPTLYTIMTNITNYKAMLDKTFIQYTLAPKINKAIRAGGSAEALNIIMNEPYKINDLDKYAELQKEAVDTVCYVKSTDAVTGDVKLIPKKFNTDTICVDIDKFNINPNYTGVIASRFSGENNKNTAVFVHENGLCRGSFRGRLKDIDYRKFFTDCYEDIYAQGHPTAFGFKTTEDRLKDIMSRIKSIEPEVDPRPYLTAGQMNEDEKGIYHIDNMLEFKQLGYLWRMAIGNSKVASGDEISIRVKANDVVLKDTIGKLFIYNVLGMECKAFTALSGKYFNLYPEYTNEISLFIK